MYSLEEYESLGEIKFQTRVCKQAFIQAFQRFPEIYHALRDFVPFVQFKNVKNTYGGLLLLKLQTLPCNFTLLKVNLVHRCFFAQSASCCCLGKFREIPRKIIREE